MRKTRTESYNQTKTSERECCRIVDETPQEKSTAEESKGYRIFSIIRSVFIYLLAAMIIIAAAFFAADRSPDKSLFGYRYYVVLTDSMAPAFRSGDMVFVKRCAAEAIQAGDVITFNPSSGSDAYLTHRVTEKLSDYQGTGVTCFRTKGDANDSADSFLIDENRVIGVVKLSLPKLGLVIRFVQLRWYYMVPLLILVFVFFGLMRRYFEMKEENEEQAANTTNEIQE